MDIAEYLESINSAELRKFIDSTSSNIVLTKDIEKKVSDTSWVDMVEDCIPYLDNIIRNPRRFIVQEENIIPIEKAKAVSEEAIKHLAQNTSLIQEVHEDGTVIPIKILNVFREETIDLYENRFIKSLVDNLYKFVNERLEQNEDQSSYAKVHSIVKYDGVYKNKDTEIKVNVSLDANTDNEVNGNNNDLQERIEHIRDVVSDYKNSKMMVNLQECLPVRSPIRKTNVILKEPNFMRALDLWEFLEKESEKPGVEYIKDRIESNDAAIKEKYDIGFFIGNNAINEDAPEVYNKYDSSLISKLVNDFVIGGDITEAEFRALINREFKAATKRKEKMIAGVKSKFDDFVNEFDKNKKKAYALIK